MKKNSLLLVALTTFAAACGGPAPGVSERLGEVVSQARQEALLDAGWFKAVVTRTGTTDVDTVAANPLALAGYDLVSWRVPVGETFFADPESGRVIFGSSGGPGLIPQLVNGGYDFRVTAHRRGEIPSREALGALAPEPQSVTRHPVVGRMSDDEVKALLATGWRMLPPGSHTQGVMLFKDPESLATEGLYLGRALASEPTRMLFLPVADECTCISPECGNRYKCPCVARTYQPRNAP